MKSAAAKALDSTYNRMQWAGEEYLLEEVIDEAGDRFEKSGEVYADELIYWIGCIYRYWHYVTGESSKEIYKQASVKLMKQNYMRLYMMTPEEVIEVLIRKNLICLRQEVAMLGCPVDKALVCRRKWSVS